jgi:Cd2+/Zn2+-exporting ATPase
LGDDLRRLPETLLLARCAKRLININIALALCLKLGYVFGVLWGVWGENFLIGGVLSDEGAPLLVTANGLRLLYAPRSKRWGALQMGLGRFKQHSADCYALRRVCSMLALCTAA